MGNIHPAHVRSDGMNKSPGMRKFSISVLLALVLVLCGFAHMQAQANKPGAPKSVRLTVIVTGGNEKKPVDSASVYVKFNKVEMNLKTNLSGICHAPEIPAGKVLIQVIAPGWKPFGEYYDAKEAEQTISIALSRPPKWY
jgi:hypothetical protein